MKSITVRAKSDGTVQIKVEGVSGSSCKEMTKELEQSLFEEVIKDEKTAEYYETETVTQKRKATL